MVRGIPYEPNYVIGQNIKRWRRIRGVSQRQLAERSGISDRSISKWETGAGGITMTNLYKLCQALEVDFDTLVRESGGS